MKVNPVLLILAILLIFSSCQKNNKNKPHNSQKKEDKSSFMIKRNVPYIFNKSIKEKIPANKDFVELLQGFEKESFTKEELIDMVNQHKKIYTHIRQVNTQSIIDTVAVKSRIALAEIYNNKLGFLLNKKHTQPDTIQKTFTILVSNLNRIIKQISIYNTNIDEFRDILSIDSISQDQKDSLLHPANEGVKNKIVTLKKKKIIKKIDVEALKKRIPKFNRNKQN